MVILVDGRGMSGGDGGGGGFGFWRSGICGDDGSFDETKD